jgi:uncharacterized protein VirK/YbjX
VSGFVNAFLVDCRRWSLPVAVLRALRASRVLRLREAHARLHANAAYLRHVATVAPHDPWFYLSHRHYLARGLTTRQRVEAALLHYEHEVKAFDPGYFQAVYHGDGLELWRTDTGNGVFDIRLLPGADVLNEGGVSIVAHFNGRRIGVLSYSTVDAGIFQWGRQVPTADPALPRPLAVYVTRKQAMPDHSYQEVFNKAFDRSTLGHFCFAALTGVAMAQGHRQVIAIAPSAHPVCTPALQDNFRVAYTDFWKTMRGRESPPFGYVIDLPMRMTPLEALDNKQRKRAMARRAHIEAVRVSAYDKISAHLLASSAVPASTAARRRPRAARSSQRALVFCALMAIV